MKSFLPDVNVWIALAYQAHAHHTTAGRWFGTIESEQIYFCRLTQLSFLRLLTNSRVMGDQVKSQIEAWRIFDRWFDDERIAFLHEPPQTEPIFRKLTQRHQANTNVWPDAYLAAVAKSAGLLVVTLDQGFGHMAGADAVVLQG